MVYTKEQAEAYYRELQNSTFKAYSQATLIHYRDEKENECIQKLDEVKRCLQEAWDLLNQNDTKEGYIEFLMKGTSSGISDHPLEYWKEGELSHIIKSRTEVRLIDANKLRYEAETCLETTEDFQELIDNQPTIDFKEE